MAKMTPNEALHEISTKVFRNTDDFEMRISKDCYKAIRKALEKRIPQKPIHIHEEYDKHDWYKNSDGTVDDYHWEYEYCSGVQCKRCGQAVCTLCHEDYDEEAGKCVIDKHLCPNCKRGVGKYKYCPDCGQALDWSDTE